MRIGHTTESGPNGHGGRSVTYRDGTGKVTGRCDHSYSSSSCYITSQDSTTKYTAAASSGSSDGKRSGKGIWVAIAATVASLLALLAKVAAIF